MSKLGLVSVLYNSNDVLEDFFKSLSIQLLTNYHLYLVDNSPSAETDSLLAALAVKYPVTGYTHLKKSENLGVANGNNTGIKLALAEGCDHVILLNNDIEFVQSNLLHDIQQAAIHRDEDLIIPKILFWGTRKIWMAGGKFIHYKGTSRSLGRFDNDSDLYNKEAYFNCAPTCFMLISRKVFEAVGLMDEKYFVYYDDNDFLMRAMNHGFKIWYLPRLEVFHKVSISTGGHESLFSIYYLNRNRIYFVRKHYMFPLRQIALAHAIFTKSIRYLMYDKSRRQQLLRAFSDGFKMSVNSKLAS